MSPDREERLVTALERLATGTIRQAEQQEVANAQERQRLLMAENAAKDVVRHLAERESARRMAEVRLAILSVILLLVVIAGVLLR